MEKESNKLLLGCKNTIIPDSVVKIEDDAFRDCEGLTSIIIPDSVKKIGRSAFRGCTSLTSFIVSEGNEMYDSRDNCNAIIETESNRLIIGCQNTVIPDSVTVIGDGAFWACKDLTSINIPDSVDEIEIYAFFGCTQRRKRSRGYH